MTADAPLGQRLFQGVNEARRKHGRGALRSSAQLRSAALAHAFEMGAHGFFSHDSFDGSGCAKRLERYFMSKGFRHWSAGENLFWVGTEDVAPPEVIDAWLASAGHRRNLLDPGWQVVGVVAARVPSAPGVYGGADTTIVVADFGARSKA